MVRALFEIVLYGVGVWHGYLLGHRRGTERMAIATLKSHHAHNDGSPHASDGHSTDGATDGI